MPREPFAGWKSDATLEALAEQTERVYYSIDQSPLQRFPHVSVRRCWEQLRQDPFHVAAITILLNFYRGRFERLQSLLDVCAIKRLEDILGAVNLQTAGKLGHTILSLLNTRLMEGMRGHGVSPEALRGNPMASVEEAFGGSGRNDEGHLLAGLLQAGYRGVASEHRDTTPYAIALGLREAYNFYMAKRPDLAEGALGWCDYRIATLGSSFPAELHPMLAQFYLGAASGARQGMHFANQLDLLNKAKLYLDRGNELADCMYWMGQEYERRQDLYSALECYEEALRVPGLDEPGLLGVIQVSLSKLQSASEGDFAKLIELDPKSAKAYGYEPDFFRVFKRLGTKMLAGEEPSDDDQLEAIQSVMKILAKWRGEDHPADRVLSMYLLVLKFALSIKAQARLPFDYVSILAEADRYISGAKASRVLEYEQLKITIRELGVSDEASRRLSLQEKLASLSKLLNEGRPMKPNVPGK